MVDKQACERQYETLFPNATELPLIKNDMICAGSQGQDACQVSSTSPPRLGPRPKCTISPWPRSLTCPSPFTWPRLYNHNQPACFGAIVATPTHLTTPICS